MTIGKFIKEIRLNHKLTQEQFAKELGLGYSWLIKVEQGKIKDPQFSKMVKIIRFSQIPLYNILKLFDRILEGSN